ncbi:MAG: LacI family DNA-binding transcriptional regulator [Verrucomicrobia bacterium]|nr:LacI family DNA-binding transcriptional regulator [Verrucomicrobiota bacterium]
MINARQIDIAKRLKISRQAVAFALSNQPCFQRKLRPATRQRVLRVAHKMGYVPHYAARSLKLGKTQTIVLATYETLHHPYVHELIEELQAELAVHGYQTVIELIHRAADQAHVYRTFMPGRCDGVVMLQLPSVARGMCEVMRRRGTSVVAIEPGEAEGFSRVDYDRVEVVRMGTSHLLERGRQRVAFVLDAKEGLRRKQRLQGYGAALKQFGLRFDRTLLFPWPVESEARELWARIATLQPRPTAVICYNDELALRLMLAMRKAQVRIPQDVALVTQGNSRVTTLADVPLTAVDTNNPAIAKTVVEILLEEIKEPRTPPRRVLVKPCLVVRESSGTGGDSDPLSVISDQ